MMYTVHDSAQMICHIQSIIQYNTDYDKLRKEITDSITTIIDKYNLSDVEIQKIFKNIENII